MCSTQRKLQISKTATVDVGRRWQKRLPMILSVWNKEKICWRLVVGHVTGKLFCRTKRLKTEEREIALDGHTNRQSERWAILDRLTHDSTCFFFFTKEYAYRTYLPLPKSIRLWKSDTVATILILRILYFVSWISFRAVVFHSFLSAFGVAVAVDMLFTKWRRIRKSK